MQTTGKLLAGVCAVFFIITGVAALLLFNIERKAFQSEPYKQAFENQNLYERMPVVLASALTESLLGNSTPAGSESKDFISTILSFLPPQEIKTLTDTTLDSVFAYLNGETDSVTISLASLKLYLASPAGVDAVLNILETQPDCSAEQLLEMTIGAFTGGEFIFCNPPPELTSLVRPLVETQFQLTASLFPDHITLVPSTQSGTENDPRLRFNRIRAVMKITPVLPLIFMIFITMLAVRNLTDLLKWWGYPLWMTGVIGLVISIIGASIVGFIIQSILETQGAGIISPTLLTTMRETFNAVARQILNPVAIQASLLAILGVVMIGVTLLLDRRKQLSTT